MEAVDEQVPKDKLVAAISFNSLSNKISQTVGPILGGYLIGVRPAPRSCCSPGRCRTF